VLAKIAPWDAGPLVADVGGRTVWACAAGSSPRLHTIEMKEREPERKASLSGGLQWTSWFRRH